MLLPELEAELESEPNQAAYTHRQDFSSAFHCLVSASQEFENAFVLFVYTMHSTIAAFSHEFRIFSSQRLIDTNYYSTLEYLDAVRLEYSKNPKLADGRSLRTSCGQ